MIHFSCPKCGKHLKAPEEYAGKQIKCTRCALSLSAPSGPEASSPDAAKPVTSPAPAVSPPHAPDPGAVRSIAQAVNRRPLLVGGIGGGLLAVIIVGLALYFLLPSDLNQNLADLKSSDPAVSKPALEWLNEATPNDSQRAKVTAALEPLLFDGDVHKNLDPDLLLRVYLLWADKDNVPAMIRMVQTPTMPAWNTKKTGMVMEALGKMRDPRAADALAEKLSDPKLNKQAVNALTVLGAKAEPAVLDYLFDPDADTRQRASQLLDGYGTKYRKIVDEAVDRLQSSATKTSAVLWFVDNPPSDEAEKAEAAPLLAKLLEDLSPEVCRDALQALKQWATVDCLPALQAYAQREQKNASGNPQLIDVLAQFKDERAADAIALQLPNDHARANAVKALVTLGPVASKAVLRYINYPAVPVQKAARDLCPKLDISAERQLEQTLADAADPRIHRSRTALQHLVALRPDETNRAKVSQALNAALLDHDAGIREDALNAVKIWGTQANTAALMKLLGDFQTEDAEPDGRVIEILGALKDPKAASALAQGLTHARQRGAVSKALIAIGPGAEDAVVPFLSVADRAARFEACHILGEIGTSKSLTALGQARDSIGATDGPFYQEALLAMQKIMARK